MAIILWFGKKLLEIVKHTYSFNAVFSCCCACSYGCSVECLWDFRPTPGELTMMDGVWVTTGYVGFESFLFLPKFVKELYIDPEIDLNVKYHERSLIIPVTSFIPTDGEPVNPSPAFLGPLMTPSEAQDPVMSTHFPLSNPDEIRPLATLDPVYTFHFDKEYSRRVLRNINKSLVPLATILHEERQVALSQLLLEKLYSTINHVIDTVRIINQLVTNVGGPTWLLHLWLNAILKHHLTFTNNSVCRFRFNYGCLVENYDVSSLSSNTNSFLHFMRIFANISKSSTDIDFSPFADRTLGPDWFRTPFPGSCVEERQLNDVIWGHYLSHKILFSGLPDSSSYEDKEVFLYYSNCVARQFGLCQGLPAPCFHQCRTNSIMVN
ncbi:hypothetical protein RIF29_33156 [Crotalaria pallida]|uniref:Uncharacterized protein n=1 Tax=Crotalaria pallida TaxID=3830 RepID=A0AAN9HWM8_CROPI